ncbi:PREDICTED: sulfotransferase family cytosolic 1B member 1-like [Branchiostoma belcheri]|uniref:Sulfotransferase n=1 Tax=Branchiostoma belcheri TaxID=7741 RepID=A0A6P5A2I2_BRABE|nr:PREDICTED: sulfotransferase family cytosolic 1B member 1-like [Branchiostoma belcheri]
MSYEKATWEYKGVCFPLDITKETLEAMPGFQIRDDDIVVASYIKTGSNWLTTIVLKILGSAGKLKASADSMDVGPIEITIPFAKQPGYITVADMPSPRFMKTHLPIQFAPKGISKPQNKVKVLVPMRNPKDTAVSMYHYVHIIWQLIGYTVNIPWEEFAQNFIEGKVPWGDYCDHLLGWWQMRDDPHFLFIKYEDMKKDLLNSVKTVAAFLEVDLDETTMKDIAEACTFDNMKTELANSDRPDKRTIARKGIVGDWKNMFSPEQCQAFDAWYEKKLGGTGISFDFE